MRYLIIIAAVIRCAAATTNTVAVILNIREGANVSLSAEHPGSQIRLPPKWYLSFIQDGNETVIRQNTTKVTFDNTTKMATIHNFTRNDVGGYGLVCIYNESYFSQMYHLVLREEGAGTGSRSGSDLGGNAIVGSSSYVFVFVAG